MLETLNISEVHFEVSKRVHNPEELFIFDNRKTMAVRYTWVLENNEKVPQKQLLRPLVLLMYRGFSFFVDYSFEVNKSTKFSLTEESTGVCVNKEFPRKTIIEAIISGLVDVDMRHEEFTSAVARAQKERGILEYAPLESEQNVQDARKVSEDMDKDILNKCLIALTLLS